MTLYMFSVFSSVSVLNVHFWWLCVYREWTQVLSGLLGKPSTTWAMLSVIKSWWLLIQLYLIYITYMIEKNMMVKIQEGIDVI
jgi:hypothetical protein